MKKRFYDQEPSVSQAVELMLVFPDDLLGIVANGLSLIAEREYDAKELLENFRSLGTDKVLALYKSKQKKRKYDQNPQMHRAMNYLMVMSPEKQQVISKRIVELVGYIQEYFKTCKEYTVRPEVGAVESLTETYVHMGAEETRKFLKTVKDEFIRQLQESGPPTPEPVAAKEGRPKSISEAIRDEGMGMRIKGDIQ